MTRLLSALSERLTARIGTKLKSADWCGSAPEKSSHPTAILNGIGDTWRCWRLSREPDRDFAWRLGLHLQALAIAVEDDLEGVLAIERQLQKRSDP